MLNSVDPFELMLILSKVTIYVVPFIKYMEGGIDYGKNKIFLDKALPYRYIQIGEEYYTRYRGRPHQVKLKRLDTGQDYIDISSITSKTIPMSTSDRLEAMFRKIAKYIERRQYAIR